jgi:alcohol dehydrogenase
MWKYFLPTRVFSGTKTISHNNELFREIGTNAFIVTGRSSAIKSGALDDVQEVLTRWIFQAHYLMKWKRIPPSQQLSRAEKCSQIARAISCWQSVAAVR